jgi:hypothetical protein
MLGASLVLAQDVRIDGEDGARLVAEILRDLVHRRPEPQPCGRREAPRCVTLEAERAPRQMRRVPSADPLADDLLDDVDPLSAYDAPEERISSRRPRCSDLGLQAERYPQQTARPTDPSYVSGKLCAKGFE